MTMVKAGLSCLALMVFVWVCTAWGEAGVSSFPYRAGAMWFLVALVLSRLWHPQLRRVLLTLGGALLVATLWSITLVDFPPWAIERLPLCIVLLIVLCPAFVAGSAGAAMREGYTVSGGLMLLLGGVAVFPVSIHNAQRHMGEVCADVSYVYPYVTPIYGLTALVLMTGLGVGAAALGHFLRARLSVVTPTGT